MTPTRTTENDFAARRQHYELLRQAVRAYGFVPGAMVRVGSGYRVEGPAGPRFLKRLNYGPAEATFIYHALEYLRRNGFAEAPRINLTTDGVPFIVPSGELYYLEDWYDVAPADLSDPSVLGGCVDLMARLHKAGVGFTPPEAIADVRNDYGSWLDKCVGRLREMYSFAELAEDGKRSSAFDNRYARVSLLFARQAEEAVRRLAELPLAEVAKQERHAKALCHRDFTARNLALDARSRIRLLDFDNIAREIRLDDVAKLLRRAAYLDVERAGFIVDRYGQAMGRALSSEELALISAYLLFPAEFWSVGSSRFRKNRLRERKLRRLVRDSEAWASFAMALADLDVPRGELAGQDATRAAAERGRFPEHVALPDGPQLPSVPFTAEAEENSLAMPDIELVRFDHQGDKRVEQTEEVASIVTCREDWIGEESHDEPVEVPAPIEVNAQPEEETWAGAQLPEGAEPWVEPIQAAAEGTALPAAEADLSPVVASPVEDSGEYLEARRQLITSASTIVWGKWPKPKEQASGGGQQV